MPSGSLKVFVVGPRSTGKTAVANYLAEITDTLVNSEYHPTQGVRILECERTIKPNGKGRDVQMSGTGALVIECEMVEC
ncbi:hypothetical protein HK101_004101 [Irineochytrium annulatum]|nr:hypothetical protein HK101_004101 [Irineochytrium annulatum]